MEGVSTVMPLTVKTGVGILDKVLAGGGSGSTSKAAEARAESVEAQAQRQAETEARSAHEQTDDLREAEQRKGASARVAAANSGLELSGSSLLSLDALENASDEKISRVLGDSAVRQQSILDSGAEQARSIRLSGRTAQSRSGGLGSLLRLGGQSIEF
jgi:vacuolar-type H+-ATPase subunit E/Vma4